MDRSDGSNGWLFQVHEETCTVEIGDSHACYVVDAVGFFSPDSIPTHSDGPLKAIGPPVRRHHAEPLNARIPIVGIRFEPLLRITLLVGLVSRCCASAIHFLSSLDVSDRPSRSSSNMSCDVRFAPISCSTSSPTNCSPFIRPTGARSGSSASFRAAGE